MDIRSLTVGDSVDIYEARGSRFFVGRGWIKELSNSFVFVTSRGWSALTFWRDTGEETGGRHIAYLPGHTPTTEAADGA